MSVSESVRIALTSLTANKMRSGLTMLGIIIGVMSVIAMLSIGQGAQEAITAQITSIGTNLLYIRPELYRRVACANRRARRPL
jgi:putative ABC transport system permease protein